MPRAATNADIFNAIAESQRRDILVYLAPRERAVGEIVEWLEAGQPHVQTRLKEYGVEFLKNLVAPEDHEELIRKGEEFIEEWSRTR